MRLHLLRNLRVALSGENPADIDRSGSRDEGEIKKRS